MVVLNLNILHDEFLSLPFFIVLFCRAEFDGYCEGELIKVYIYIYISFFLPLFGAFVLFLCCNLEFARSGNMHEKPYLVLRKTYLYILIGSSCWNLLKVFLSFIKVKLFFLVKPGLHTLKM